MSQTVIIGGSTGTPIPTVRSTAGIYNTYSATAKFTVANSATDFFTITGSATKEVRILHISLTGTQTTATNNSFYLLRRSAANSGGTSTNPTAVAVGSSMPAATAVVSAYTANPASLGTLVGNVQIDSVFIPDTSTNKGGDTSGFYGYDVTGIPLAILTGAASTLSLNLGGVTLAGNSLCCHVIWQEV